MKYVWSLFPLVSILLILFTGCSNDINYDDENILSLGWVEYRDNIYYADELSDRVSGKAEDSQTGTKDVEYVSFTFRTTDGYDFKIYFSGKDFDLYNHEYTYSSETPSASGSYFVGVTTMQLNRSLYEFVGSKEGKKGSFQVEKKDGRLEINGEFEVENMGDDHTFLKGGTAKVSFRFKY